jgi:tetratricopeptide (TPR) repeat protein
MTFSILIILISVETPIKEKYQKALKIKNPLEAVEYYRQVVNEAPNTPYADSSLFRIGMLYYILGDFGKTIDHLTLIYKRGKKSYLYSKTSYWLKLCYENLGDSAKAKEIERRNKNLISETKEQKPDPKEKNIEVEKRIKQPEEKKGQGYHTIQLGAYEDEKWLEYFLGKLKENNVSYFIKKEGSYTKIFSGKFDTRIEAEKYLEEIKNKGFHGFITFDSNP